MYRAGGNLGAGGSPRTGGNVSQTGRPLGCMGLRVPVIVGDFGTGKSPGRNSGVGGTFGACWRLGAVRSLMAGRRPRAEGDGPR